MKNFSPIAVILAIVVSLSACGGSNAPKDVDDFQRSWNEGSEYEREDACKAYGYFENNQEAFIAFMVDDMIDDELAANIYEFMTEVC